MPLYLPPVSRRSFIARTFLGASALLLDPGLFAQASGADPNRWALLSDTHIAADPKLTSRDVNMTEHLQSAVREVLAMGPKPGGVLVCGDCAYSSGRSEDYRSFAGLLDPLREGGLPVTLALGNHDNRERFREIFKRADRPASEQMLDRQVALVRSERVNWFVLDSLEQTNSTPGLLGTEQLKWLAEMLDANESKPAIVMVHHNPGVNGNMGLKDTVALFEIIRPRQQVKAYIFGHTHTWNVERDSSGLHLINLPPVGYVFKKEEPSGWVQADSKPDALRLEFHAIDKSHKANGEIHELKWRKS